MAEEKIEKKKKKKEFWEKHFYLSLFWEFFKIGLFTIGGGIVMIPLIERIAVEDKKWITKDEMLDCIALSQALPGVIAINAATFVGQKKAGIKGGIIATIGVIIPSFVIILAIANVLNVINQNKYVQGAFVGIKACVTGLVAVVAFNLARNSLKEWIHWVLAIGAFLAVAIFNINAVFIVIVAAIIGVVYYVKIAKNIQGGEK